MLLRASAPSFVPQRIPSRAVLECTTRAVRCGTKPSHKRCEARSPLGPCLAPSATTPPESPPVPHTSLLCHARPIPQSLAPSTLTPEASTLTLPSLKPQAMNPEL
eukprot:1118374-Rhodomonas_salina.1